MFGLTERRARSNIEDFYGQLGILREQLEELAAPVNGNRSLAGGGRSNKG